MSKYEVAPGGVVRRPRACGGEIMRPGTIVSAEDFGGGEHMVPLIDSGKIREVVDVDVTYSETGSNRTEAERQAQIQADHEAEIEAMRAENERLRAANAPAEEAVAPVVEAPEVPVVADDGGVKMTHTVADLQALIADIEGDENKLALLVAMITTANEKFEDQDKVFDIPDNIPDAIALLTLDTE